MKKLLKYLKNYKLQTILAPLFKMLEATFELFVPLVVANIIDIGIKNQDKAYITKSCLILFALALIGLICAVTAQYFSAKAAMGFGREVRRDLFKHIGELSYIDMDKLGQSTLITRMTSDVNQIQTGVNMVLRLFLRSPFIVFGAVIMAFTIDVKTARIFLVVLPLLIIVVFGIMLLSIPLHKKVQGNVDSVTLKTRENLSGARVIRAFNREDEEILEFEAAADSLMKNQLVVGRLSAFLNPVTYVIINVGIIAIISRGSHQVYDGTISQGEVVALVNYMSQILVELVKLANLIISCTKAMACANRVSSIFDTVPSQVYKTETVEEVANAPRVEFKAACIDYNLNGENSVENVTLKVMPGETIGIIGGTGSGKSSLVNLIPRFYDTTDGDVFVDGVNVKDYPKKQLRDKIGIVPQKAVLFKGTIEENLRMGNDEATEKDLEEALDVARALDFVNEKEGKLKFMIAQGGRNLSGGQKQRLTIARAVLRKPEILILDDSSSALDFATEKELRNKIAGLSKSMTTFIVSQRSSSIRHADNIIVLDDGKVCGIGKHEELLKSCEVYKEICLSQMTKEEVAKYE